MLDPSSASYRPLALPGLMRLSAQADALMLLPSNACRWPVGQSWCGRPAVHGAYCNGHHLRSRKPLAPGCGRRATAAAALSTAGVFGGGNGSAVLVWRSRQIWPVP